MLLYHLPGRTGTASSITCLMHRGLWCVGGGRGRGSSGRGKCLSAGAHVSRVRLERSDPGGAAANEGAGDCGPRCSGPRRPREQLEFCSGHSRASEGLQTGE